MAQARLSTSGCHTPPGALVLGCGLGTRALIPDSAGTLGPGGWALCQLLCASGIPVQTGIHHTTVAWLPGALSLECCTAHGPCRHLLWLCHSPETGVEQRGTGTGPL